MSEIKHNEKVALITGGASGIGAATARRFCSEGITPVIIDLNEEGAKAIAEEVGGFYVTTDVTKFDSCQAAATTVFEKYGRIDILVCCAGGASSRILNQPGTFATCDISRIEFGIGLNLMGAIYMAKSVVNYMIEAKSGRIIFLGSAAGVVGTEGCVEYSASKGGLESLTKGLAMELGRYGINVTIVSPGPIMTRPAMAGGNTYLHRCGQPEEVASMINYLASDEASFVTGHNFIVDGGRCLGGLPYGDWFKNRK